MYNLKLFIRLVLNRFTNSFGYTFPAFYIDALLHLTCGQAVLTIACVHHTLMAHIKQYFP